MDGNPIARRWARALLLAMCLASTAPLVAAGAVVYTDALAAGWDNWSWNTTVNFSAASPVQSGARSLSARHTAAWAGLYLHTNATLTAAPADRIEFWLHGGATGGQRVRVGAYDGSYAPSGTVVITATANTWTSVSITLASLGSPATVSGLVWQDNTGGAQPVYYLDDISIVAGPAPPEDPPGTGPALAVDLSADRHAISPLIYGMNWADEALAAELRLPVRRWGGNAVTRYNWQQDTSNRGSDWYFENIPNDNANPGALPAGSASDQFVEQDRRTDTQSILTVPLIGWTPKSRDYAGGFSVSKYGAQQSVDPWRPDFGNGIRTNGTAITSNDPLDTSLAIGPAFVTGWINHLKSRYGPAAAGGVAFYNLDNEPMLWNSTHRDVHPAPAGYDEMRERTYACAAAVKAADPGAQTLGPVLWGWTAYFYSALDAAPGGAWWTNPQDRNAHGGTPFVEWYLQQMRLYEQTTGTRLLDFLDLHYYPQASGVALATAGGPDTQALRLRATRSLWDPTYTDESWIAEPVRLIPRMRDWVNTHYPGTRTAVTEYNFGGLEHINGALAQADVLGIFGREGLDLATMWDPPAAAQPGAFAFRMYRNHDGAGAGFGETAVRATSADQARLSVYAAQRDATRAVTVVIINKTAGALTSALAITGVRSGDFPVEVWRYSAVNLAAIAREADASLTGGAVAATYPASSITLLVIPPAAVAPPASALMLDY